MCNQLDSVNGRPFAMYVYFHTNDGGGAAYSFLPLESSQVTPSPTVPTEPSTTLPSSNNATLPQHTARVDGAARTEDGEDMSPICVMVSRKK